MTACLREKIAAGPQKLVLAGFGVGYSWCSAALQSDGIKLVPLIEVDCEVLLEQLYSTSADSNSHLPAEIRSAFHGRR